QYGGLSRMVNRHDDTVNAVFVGGRAVFLDGTPTDLVGKQRTGRFLRATHKAPAVRKVSWPVSVDDTVRDLWKALSARDFELAKTYVADDCIYFDVPVGPPAAAAGP